MPSPQVERLVKRILQALPQVADLDAAILLVRDELDTLSPGLAATLSSEIEEAREIVSRDFERVEILHLHSVIRKRPQWYFGPKPTDRHWPAVQGFLINGKGWHEDDVRAIDDASSEVVSLLASPQESQFSCRGLVVGHVQSGKTANMTAVIAKALDAGYNTVIVLAGLTNKLRYQTQLRLYEDLVVRNPLDWQVLTPNELNRDFRAPAQGGFLSHSDKAQLAVIKKNVSPLQELKNAVERTLPAVLKRLRILVIDDECDQASVNSARGELDMTAINQRIRELLSLLPAVSYVGYTATPFANVLINPYRIDGQELDDLYPRDFITALPLPERYFGTERLFGKTPADPENVLPEEEGLDMIRDVPSDEECLLQPRNLREKDAFQPVMTETLKTAILYFLACCAARRARGDAGKHMTMLVHTSAYVIAHERVASLIEGWVDVHRKQLIDRASPLGRRIEEIWDEERGRLPDDITDAPSVSPDQIFEHLPDVLSVLEFPVENGASDDRIDYTGAAKTYIVVGGSILARGLTLEGLMVSFFLRTTNQYDTLLQMGRWFGYRPRYEDLPRIWMPEELKLRFRALASLEQEIRDDIEQYRLRDLTPMDIAVRIRSIPGMAITAATKMRAARQCAVSYWGTHRQTFRFAHRDGKLLLANWRAGEELASRAEALGLRDPEAQARGRKLWRGVPRSSIQRFLETYTVQATHADLDRRMILPFIANGDSRLDNWNVGIVEARNGPISSDPLGSAGTIRLVKRARISGDGDADIKALMSKQDVLFDCPETVSKDGDWEDLKAARLEIVGQVPLLLLYGIERTSEPQRESKNRRVALDAAYDVLGYGIVFPGSVTEGGNYVSVNLSPLSADEIEEIAAEEAAQAEAAGVE
ncbi:MAG TPA: Z1 domain-containing protein [Acidobacteriota bacterium]|nr:Z1 domain-containing protein [Acidobacteriota bacterium]